MREGPARTPARGGSPARTAIGLLGLAALLAYAAFVHHGIGPSPGSAAAFGLGAREPHWWDPQGFLLRWDPWGLFASLRIGIPALVLPAVLLATVVFLGTRSALARALALSSVLSVALFGFYGIYAPQVWDFFAWRGSLTLVGVASLIGFAAAAPLFGERVFRRPGLGFAVYVPVFLALVALQRHATGTDESLRFNVSPWPAVPVFGLELGAYTVAGIWAGLALGLVGVLSWPARRLPAALAVAAGIALPAVWFAWRFGGGSIGALLFLAALSAVALALASFARGGEPNQLGLRATAIGLGAALVCAPLVSGRALASADYQVTRFVRAERLIGALRDYYEREGVYPDELSELVANEELSRIPRPRIGFDVAYALDLAEEPAFSYQSLGSSYVLEFDATEWVQCAYSPPWEEEEWEEDGDEEEIAERDQAEATSGEGDEDEQLDEAWSCPAERPELW